jgi:serine protease Do
MSSFVSSTRKTTIFYVALIAIASLVVGMVIASRLDLSPTSSAQTLAFPTTNSTPLNVPIDSTTFRNIAKGQSPMVVSIRTEMRQRTQDLSEFFGGGGTSDDLLDRFFGGGGGQGSRPGPESRRQQPREHTTVAAGSGFIINRDGYILTNNHVVEGATKIEVQFFDEEDNYYPAKVVGRDPLTDSALIQLIDKPNRPLTVAKFGDSSVMEPGDWVMAIGNPFNLAHTVSVGVISATARPFPVSESNGGSRFANVLQTDAAINPGNSGGPLTNALGEVVGINSSIFTNSGGSVGLGFAIPIERALRVADEIIRNGAVRRAWVGLEVGGAAAMRNWKSQGGVEVAGVTSDGPADRAGLRAGDVLVQANGRRLRNYLDWEAVKLDLHVGDAVDLTVRTGGSSRQRRIVTGDLPTVTAEKVTVLQDLQLITVTPSVQAERGIRSERGALIFKISPQVSRATGLQAGDVIVAINRTAVRAGSQVGELLNARSGEPIRVYFERDGQITFTDLAFR